LRVLGIIPARAGSKRLPGKNTRLLGGRPLAAWTFQAASASTSLTKVCLSTDDRSLCDIARAYGIDAPFLRPAELASDTATSVSVMLHAIEHYERHEEFFDAVVLLQPTSPFREASTIDRAVDVFKSTYGTRDYIGVSRATPPPEWCFKVRDGLLEPIVSWDAFKVRSQDLSPSWRVNGAIYIHCVQRLKQLGTLIHEYCAPLPFDNEHEVLDIDTQEDWDQAIAVLASHPTNDKP
jgi:N-acylneuraminate cytidylyltransferase/CMP-N,N'-diacetyllegionaminic acid synthase